MWLSSKFEDDIDDFFLPTYAVNTTLRLSDLVDPSSFLFLILTLSEIEFEKVKDYFTDTCFKSTKVVENKFSYSYLTYRPNE